MRTITKEQEIFLNKCTNGTWKLNTETGLVDIDGDFNCAYRGLKDFQGIRFGNIRGFFNYSNNNLVSLEGAPQEVGRNFYCGNNELVSLEGAPKKVGKSFDCSRNKLASLEGAPQELQGSLDCSDNNLVSLEGAPKKVGGYFYCSYNQLVSLEGAPQEIGKDIFCDVITLRGCPIDLLDKIYFYQDNKSFILKDYIKMIINGLDPKIYLKKMI